MAGKVSKFSTELKEAPSTPNLRVLNCPKCAAAISLRAQGQSIAAVCNSCAAIVDVSDPSLTIIDQGLKKGSRKQVIPLGRRGKLHGTTYEVIGYMERTDGTGLYDWSEYLLYNPLKGFRWLMEAQGHWSDVKLSKSKPKKVVHDSVNFLGKDYHLFHRGTARVAYVVGEFYWRVKINDKSQVEDYISPPESISFEKNETEKNWSVGHYIPAEDVRTNFGITDPMPIQTGVAPAQPSALGAFWEQLKVPFGSLIAMIVLIQFITVVALPRKLLSDANYLYVASDTEKLKVSPQFEIQGPTNVGIEISAPVSNSWLEVQGELVNDETGDTYEFESGVEFYFGRDSDGNWSEGDRKNDLILSSVPSGKYHLNVSALNGTNETIEYRVTAQAGVTTWSNFWWCLILLLIYPLIVAWRSRSFELKRWSQSDFSPYSQHHGE